MSINSKELYQAMREYVQAAMLLLASECPEGPSRILKGLDQWRRDPDNLFRRYDREDPYWVECIRSHSDRIHTLEEYRRLVHVIRSIPEINEQLETLVGTVFGAQRIEIADVTDHLIWELARIAGSLYFNERQFDQLFEEFSADLSRISFDYFSIAPLLGLKVETAPLQLDPDVVLDHMTDDEIVRCLSIGFLSGWPRSLSVADIGSAASVRVQYRVDKRIGDSDQSQFEQALKIQAAANEKAIAVLHTLRVFKEGQVSVPGLLQFSPHWPVEGGTSYQYMNPGPMPWFNKYNLTQKEGEEFRAFWGQTQSVMERGAIANAVRRFSYASDRDRDDDRLVDLMIAAESLFLSDSGAPQERGELRYRLALRAAFFIDPKECSRRAVFKHMKRAYDARSAVVHGGGEVDPDLLKSLTDTQLSLKDFVQITKNLVRIAIRKRIEMAATTGSSFVDWDTLIIPSQ